MRYVSTGSGRTAIDGAGQITANQKGSIMLEFVLAITILMVIFLGMVTLSFHFSDYYGAQKVAREGAREASITKDTAWAEVKARQEAWLWGLEPDKLSVEFDRSANTVTCRVTYLSTPFHKTFLKLVNGPAMREITMRSRATFVWMEIGQGGGG